MMTLLVDLLGYLFAGALFFYDV